MPVLTGREWREKRHGSPSFARMHKAEPYATKTKEKRKAHGLTGLLPEDSGDGNDHCG
jgi:hypothetical protein